MNRDQITSGHRARLACVYIRQSTLRQVAEHPESQRRQRALVERALDLGWPRERVVLVDEDLGRSAARTGQRLGFHDLVAQAALGKIGILLVLEVARLSRSNRDWYHLLDICAVTATLIGDAEGLYDPRAYNDRLLLGLKGTMSEAELHLMKQRLVEAMRSKAQRGEFQLRVPAGFVWDEAGRIQKSPDEQVVAAITLLFERFDRLGTVHQTQCSLAEEGIRVPVLSGSRHALRWKSPSYAYVHRVLTHPLYAGAYVYGRRQTLEVLDASQRPLKRTRKRGGQDAAVLIRDHHAGYISWEQFERNQRRIAANRRAPSQPGAPREGEALLQGLVLCGRCGRRMSVAYGRRSGIVRYVCARGRKESGTPMCQGFGAIRLERSVEALVLEALAPRGLEAMIQAAATYVRTGEAERHHWLHRIERARYEVELARRHYDAVDPANRLVGRELERRFEKALETLEGAEAEAALRLPALERPLGDAEREELRRFAQELPRLWRAPSTRAQDRKRLVRLLIEQVVATAAEGDRVLRTAVHWNGGEVTPLEVPRGRTGIHRYVAEPELLELLRHLASEFSDEQIARILHRKRLRTPKGLPFTTSRVSGLRHAHGIEAGPRVPAQGEATYTALQASEFLGVDRSTVIRWVEAGLLAGSQLTAGAPWRIRLSEEDQRRLTTVPVDEGWLPLKGAALALGVSQPTVLQKLKAGELRGVRVSVGRRSGWRIQVPARACDRELPLFETSRP